MSSNGQVNWKPKLNGQKSPIPLSIVPEGNKVSQPEFSQVFNRLILEEGFAIAMV